MREREDRISPAYIADRIRDYFSSWKIYPKDVTVIIMGKPGPTGKTWLCDRLKEMGFNAIELDLEYCRAHVEYHEETNRYTIAAKTVYVVLNDILPQYRDTDDVEQLYPKILTPNEYRDKIDRLKRVLNTMYGRGIAGNHAYGICNELCNKPLYTPDEVEHLIKARSTNTVPKIDHVIFNNPATIVFWKDGTKTVVKAQDGEDYDDEKGLAMAISKKALGNQGNYYNTFDKFLIRPEPEEEKEPSKFIQTFSELLTDETKDKLSKIKEEIESLKKSDDK